MRLAIVFVSLSLADFSFHKIFNFNHRKIGPFLKNTEVEKEVRSSPWFRVLREPAWVLHLKYKKNCVQTELFQIESAFTDQEWTYLWTKKEGLCTGTVLASVICCCTSPSQPSFWNRYLTAHLDGDSIWDFLKKCGKKSRAF